MQLVLQNQVRCIQWIDLTVVKSLSSTSRAGMSTYILSRGVLPKSVEAKEAVVKINVPEDPRCPRFERWPSEFIHRCDDH